MTKARKVSKIHSNAVSKSSKIEKAIQRQVWHIHVQFLLNEAMKKHKKKY